MDTNEILTEIRKICESWDNVNTESEPYNDPWFYIDDLVDLVKSLDKLLSSGEAYPNDWS